MDKDVIEIQKLYPRIYLACHADHVRADGELLSPRDATILAHLSDDSYQSPSALARHLKVTRATLSEAVTNLAEQGYLISETDEDDERKRRLRLTEKGLRAMSRSSVLDYERLKKLIDVLSAAERARIIDGLSLLADAVNRE